MNSKQKKRIVVFIAPNARILQTAKTCAVIQDAGRTFHRINCINCCAHDATYDICRR